MEIRSPFLLFANELRRFAETKKVITETTRLFYLCNFYSDFYIPFYCFIL